jgi:hypothetical protein
MPAEQTCDVVLGLHCAYCFLLVPANKSFYLFATSQKYINCFIPLPLKPQEVLLSLLIIS